MIARRIILFCFVALFCAASFVAGWSGHKRHQRSFVKPDLLAHYPPPVYEELPRSAPPTNALVIMIVGQSYAASWSETRYTPKSTNVFAWRQGKLYRANDPLIGTDGNGGSIWTRLGDILVEDHKCEAVVFVAATAPATTVKQWNKGGNIFGYVAYAALDARRSGLNISRICCILGESDAAAATPPEAYIRNLKNLATNLRSEIGSDVPFYVAKTRANFKTPAAAAIYKAQTDILNPAEKILPGPDIDALPDKLRWDVHLSDEGLMVVARQWEQALFPSPAAPQR